MWKTWYLRFLRAQGVQKTALLLGVSLVTTLMVSPSLDLVHLDYKVGDVISQTIVIKDNINLLDERSTAMRQEQAVKDYPPVYDFDSRLKVRTTQKINAAFSEMRQILGEQEKTKLELQTKIRQNALDQLSSLSRLAASRVHRDSLKENKSRLTREMESHQKVSKPSVAESERMERLRFNLISVEAQLNAYTQNITQLEKSLALLSSDGHQLVKLAEASDDSHRFSPAVLRAEMEKTLNISLDPSQFQLFLAAEFNPEIERKVIALLDPVLDRMILATKEGFSPPENAIQIQTLDSAQMNRFDRLDSLMDVDQARQLVTQASHSLVLSGEQASLREPITQLALKLVKPTLTENKGETLRQKGELVTTVSPVFFNLHKGDVVARAGEKATAQQVEIIKALNAYRIANPKYPQLAGTFLIILISIVLFYRMVLQFSGKRFTTLPRLILLVLLLMIPLMLAHLVLLVAPALTTVYGFLPVHTFNYLIPAALASMLAGILLGVEVAVFLGFVVSLMVSLMMDNSLGFFLYALLGSLVAALPMRHFDTRYALWLQGLRISLINMLAILVTVLMEQPAINWLVAIDLGAGLISGLAVAFFTSTLLPFLESGFDITTNMRLLELSNMNHPALKELAVRAPGTYHHSIVVGNLAESAAEGIQANALLVRVSAYYHDLGKMLCPLYFVENQHSKNYHDDLPAKTSARIIISHVKNGLEISRRYRLGSAIGDILEQHHGTSLVRYFYHKAQKEHEDTDSEPDELAFRYPGPKPQTKDSGLVMLADITESATRSLGDPSEEAIREMVQRQTTRVYSEGQLDESGMTFNDLNYIEKTFTKMLLSIHHHRIAYPDLKVVGRGEHLQASAE